MWEPGSQAPLQVVVVRAGGFWCELPAVGAVLSMMIGETGGVLSFLLGAGVRVEALEGQNPVPLPPVQFIYANPFLFCLRVSENAIPTQALVDLVGKFLFEFGKVGETDGGGERRDELAGLFVLPVLWSRAMISAGTQDVVKRGRQLLVLQASTLMFIC